MSVSLRGDGVTGHDVTAWLADGAEEVRQLVDYLNSPAARALGDEAGLLVLMANRLPDDQHELLIGILADIEAGDTGMPKETVDVLGQLRRLLEMAKALTSTNGVGGTP